MNIKKKNQIRFNSIILLTSILGIAFHQPVIAKTQTEISAKTRTIPIQLKKKQESGSDKGRPTIRRGMSSRNDCPATNIPLTALIPENKVAKVVEKKPTFWLFIPYQPNQIPRGEFILQDENHHDIYRTDLSITKGEGIIGINLPAQISLETNKIYQWYFKIYCNPDKLSIPIYVRGWLQRVRLKPKQEKELNVAISPRQQVALYAQNDIWYSALTKLVQLRQMNPENEILVKDWLQLLNDVGLEELSNAPIAGNIN